MPADNYSNLFPQTKTRIAISNSVPKKNPFKKTTLSPNQETNINHNKIKKTRGEGRKQISRKQEITGPNHRSAQKKKEEEGKKKETVPNFPNSNKDLTDQVKANIEI